MAYLHALLNKGAGCRIDAVLPRRFRIANWAEVAFSVHHSDWNQQKEGEEGGWCGKHGRQSWQRETARKKNRIGFPVFSVGVEAKAATTDSFPRDQSDCVKKETTSP